MPLLPTKLPCIQKVATYTHGGPWHRLCSLAPTVQCTCTVQSHILSQFCIHKAVSSKHRCLLHRQKYLTQIMVSYTWRFIACIKPLTHLGFLHTRIETSLTRTWKPLTHIAPPYSCKLTFYTHVAFYTHRQSSPNARSYTCIQSL